MEVAIRRPAEVFPPGEFLREELEERGWTQTDLAEILGRPVRVVNEVIMGKRRISPETAKGLAAALGTSPEFWLNLESAYQLWRVGTDDGNAVARRARLFSFGPLKEMFRRGWIEASDNVDVLEKRVADFYELADLDESPTFVGHAARKSTSYFSADTPAQTAWLYRAKRLARAVYAGRYSKTLLDEAIKQLRHLLHAPQEIRHVPRILGDAGIRFLIVEALPGTRIDGASFWLDDSPVVVLSMRFDRIDSFWYTLMHELGHIRNGDQISVDDLEAQQAEADKPESERLADQFAVEQLIPQEKLNGFIARIRPLYSATRIEAFARTCQVHPGIVVGQLHHRREIAWANLRKMLIPVRAVISETSLVDGWGSALPAQI